MKKLSIIIPIYNEEKTIRFVLDKISEVELINGIQKEIIIVNDASNDNSKKIIEKYINQNQDMNIYYYDHKENRGKGACIQTGIRNATGDYIIIQDADLEYNPNDYNILLKPIEGGYAEVVYGSRFLGKNSHKFLRKKGNKFLTLLSNKFSDLNLTDMETCYKLFKSNIIKNINLRENRFGFEPEVTQKISRDKSIRIYEVGISYCGRTYSEGKKIGWRDGFRAIYCILKYGLFRAK